MASPGGWGLHGLTITSQAPLLTDSTAGRKPSKAVGTVGRHRRPPVLDAGETANNQCLGRAKRGTNALAPVLSLQRHIRLSKGAALQLDMLELAVGDWRAGIDSDITPHDEAVRCCTLETTRSV
ncbi:uncharacterized protein SPSK_03684 [Sporothrix schenckii 1099-18]|uniref:Uncharacterized protein n=1 Tax=Sporothrix schenckii 1099-18 TaxID=1397361 RepID=A0A0F2LYQ1_SPOSC|nr:uncharacterized protein SPSK_03684 [Sporothrix schenckii 1099-18]KJR82597.1 hypothetical protein SPSK_03684 [Sporothrix schenckii 1099-18]